MLVILLYKERRGGPFGLRITAMAMLLTSISAATAFSTATAFAWSEMQVEESVAKHNALDKPAPTISRLARQMKVSGRVEVAIRIDERGEVVRTRIVSGNPLLGETVLIAVKRWKFRPFLESSGEVVPATTTLSFEFKQ